MNPLEHDVERTGQTADLGGLVGAGHALVEVAGSDGVGRPFHILQRAQTEPDQPPAAGQREHERARRHGELGQEEGVQGAGLVDERLGLHQHAVSRSAPSTARTRKAGPPEAMDPAVKYATCDPVGLGGEARDRVRKLRAVGGLADVGGALETIDDRPVCFTTAA